MNRPRRTFALVTDQGETKRPVRASRQRIGPRRRRTRLRDFFITHLQKVQTLHSTLEFLFLNLFVKPALQDDFRTLVT